MFENETVESSRLQCSMDEIHADYPLCTWAARVSPALETEAIKTEHFAAFNEVMTDLKNDGVTAIIYQDKAELLKFALANE